MTNKITPVFVDIDGVVNSSRSTFVKIGPNEHSRNVQAFAEQVGGLPYMASFALRTVDPVCVALVNRLFMDIDSSGVNAEFVLSSTHRKFFHAGQYNSSAHLMNLRLYLSIMGFHLPARFSITESLEVKRGVEVQKWLDDAEQRGVTVNDYVILDDGTDFEQTQPLVRVDATVGFSFENYTDASKFLALPGPSPILL